MKKVNIKADILDILSISSVFCVVLYVFFLLYVYGDQFPHIDEWNFVPVSGGFVEYIFSLNNENLQFFTNLQYWVVEKMELRWGVVKYISYIVYLCMIYCLYFVLRKSVGDRFKYLFILLFLVFFTHYSVENIFWCILSQSWFFFVFAFLGVYFGFNEKEAYQNFGVSFVMILCANLAMNVSLPIIFTVIYVVKNIFNYVMDKNGKFVVLKSIVFIELVVLLVGWTWFRIDDADMLDIKWGVILNLEFYKWLSYAIFAPVLAMMVPESELNVFLCIGGVFCIWLAYLFFRQVKSIEKQKAWALVFLLMGGMLAITIFRGEAVLGLNTYASRYIIYGTCLVPCFYVVMVQDENVMVRYIGHLYGVAMIVVVLMNFWGDKFIKFAEFARSSNQCILNYYKMQERPMIHYCMGKYWKNIAPKLDRFEEVYLK